MTASPARAGTANIFTLIVEVERRREENDILRAEVAALRDENEQLQMLAFGEVEYFEQLAARWSKHIPPRGYATDTRRRR